MLRHFIHRAKLVWPIALIVIALLVCDSWQPPPPPRSVYYEIDLGASCSEFMSRLESMRTRDSGETNIVRIRMKNFLDCDGRNLVAFCHYAATLVPRIHISVVDEPVQTQMLNEILHWLPQYSEIEVVRCDFLEGCVNCLKSGIGLNVKGSSRLRAVTGVSLSLELNRCQGSLVGLLPHYPVGLRLRHCDSALMESILECGSGLQIETLVIDKPSWQELSAEKKAALVRRFQENPIRFQVIG